ncbi:MAG: GNAT family N-acetyltransferase [Clostridia bacterium]|jgi:GNAT superfamily N-acetyltransferase|nr:GNAT family N-acetyltransferase [Clostridia bacterium]
MSIRKANKNDVKSILEIENRIMLLENKENGFFYGAYSEEDLKEDIEYIYVYEDKNSKVTGYICIEDEICSKNVAKSLIDYCKGYKYISGLGIHPDHFRNGYALELLNFAKENFKCVSAVYINPDINEVSIKAHLKAGFKIISEVVKDDDGKTLIGLTNKLV